MDQIQNQSVKNSMRTLYSALEYVYAKDYPPNVQSDLISVIFTSTMDHIQLRSKSKICLNSNNINFVFGYLYSNIVPSSSNTNDNKDNNIHRGDINDNPLESILRLIGFPGIQNTNSSDTANNDSSNNDNGGPAPHDNDNGDSGPVNHGGTTISNTDYDDAGHGNHSDTAINDNINGSVSRAYISPINNGNNRNVLNIPVPAAPSLIVAEPLPSLIPDNNNTSNSSNRPANASYHHNDIDGNNRMQSEVIGNDEDNTDDESDGGSIIETDSDDDSDEEMTDNDDDTEEDDSDIEIIGQLNNSNNSNSLFQCVCGAKMSGRDKFIRHQSLHPPHLRTMPPSSPRRSSRRLAQRRRLPSSQSPYAGLPADIRAMFQHPSPINHRYRTDSKFVKENPVQCEFIGCNYRCKHHYQLKRGHYAVHWDVTPFVCDCGKSYKSKGGLYRHQKSIHPPVNSAIHHTAPTSSGNSKRRTVNK